MKYSILILVLLYAFQASAEKLSGQILRVRDNIAYIQTTDGKKIPLILDDNTYYRKKKVLKKSRRTVEAPEYYLPLMSKGDRITLTYDPETEDKTTGAIKASDILIITD